MKQTHLIAERSQFLASFYWFSGHNFLIEIFVYIKKIKQNRQFRYEAFYICSFPVTTTATTTAVTATTTLVDHLAVLRCTTTPVHVNTSAEIRTPGFGFHNYPTSTVCRWLIVVRPGEVTMLVILIRLAA